MTLVTLSGATPAKPALAGAAVTVLLEAFTNALVLLDFRTLDQYRYWAVGSLTGRDAQLAVQLLPFIVVGLLLALGHSGRLNALALGDDLAITLGTQVRTTRALGAVAVILLTGAAVAGARLDGSAPITQSGGDPVHGHFFGQSSFATHALVHARAAVKAPEDLDLDVLAPLGCSVQTGVGAVLNVAQPEPGSTLVVFGAGGVGLAALMGARLSAAAQVVAVDINPERLRLARELGDIHVINSAETDPGEAIRELTRGVGAAYAVETSGRPAVLETAIASLAAAGTCVVVGAPPLGTTVPVDVPDLLGRGIRLLGTNQGDADPQRFLPRLIDLHREGRLPFDRLIRRFPFEEINEAAAGAVDGSVIKPVLVMPSTVG